MAAYTTIDDPSAYFKVQLYTGNGSANHAITFDDTDTDMQPDLVWIKNRDATDEHCLFDAQRGATKVLHIEAGAEITDTDTLDSFTSDGFQVDADVKVNTNTEKYVAWCWKESTTSGFDIDLYSGTGSARTEAHGLSAVPHFYVVAKRDGDDSRWVVYHHKNTSAPETDTLQLNTSGATSDNTRWNDTAPTSSVFSLGTDNAVNGTADGGTYVAYLWSEKQGFSKFGSYTGNGNADGTFIYCGFRPAYVFVKKTSATGQWTQWDNKRHPINRGDNTSSGLALNTTAVEATDEVMSLDFLSNGFKMRDNQSDRNGSGTTNIFAAFAEAPFVNSNGVPCNAR